MTKLTDVPFLNQLVGAMIFAPMLLGGVAGIWSDRLDRRRVVLATELALIPVMFSMFGLAQERQVKVWMTFPFMVALGVGGLVNMTAQRAMVVDLSGSVLAARALTMESVGLASASMAGPLLCGIVIDTMGLGTAFGVLAGALCLSIVILLVAPAPSSPAESSDPLPVGVPARRGVDLVRRSPALASLLGVTVIFNFFYFSFIPLVPVMAERFHAGATITGVLGAMAGGGSLVAGLVIASRRMAQPGKLYVLGAAIALAGLGLFAAAPIVVFGLLALLVAGAGSAGFSSMQSGLAIEAAGDHERGVALGVVSIAIGALPLGMLFLGITAQVLGARLALALSSLAGLASLGAWLRRYPEVLQRQSLRPEASRR